jgi:hypothetical protein
MENMEQELQRQKAETANKLTAEQVEMMSQSSGQSSLAHWVKPRAASPGL